jgi:hypothetical protein
MESGGRFVPGLLDSYRTWFTEVFLDCRDGRPGSLVYQEDTGQIVGFLGVTPQRLSFNRQPVQAAVVSNFIVDPKFRGLAGLKLFTAFLAGPQDLAIADEASEGARRLWEGLGGTTALPYSMHWFYPLRPCRFGLLVLNKTRIIPSVLERVMAPVASALDAVATRILKFPFRSIAPRFVAEELNCETLSACLSSVVRQKTLRPDYDEKSLRWLLQRAGQMQRNGRLRKILLKTEKQSIAGWYLYYVNPTAISQVIQLHAERNYASDVLDHLMNHAWREGATVLSGRLEPALTQAFSARRCIFQCGPQWMLLHSRRPELLNAFHSGDVYFSRLEGEWCTHFR